MIGNGNKLLQSGTYEADNYMGVVFPSWLLGKMWK